jgi:osmotically-inducible protein OsmY
MQKTLLMLCGLALLVAACASEPVQQSTEPIEADNTARNADNPSAQTPLDQLENEADLQISANIRRSIVADDSLSVNAHNVKIVSSGGTVTLSGPVESQEEKAAIEAKARQTPGVAQVVSQLEVE